MADFVRCLHGAFVALNVIAPLSPYPELWRYHALVMPFLYLHWITNDDTCALTLLERKLRGVSCDDSFFHSLVSPVYKFKAGTFIWFASLVLWIISMVRYFP